jgi:hypothetical protein
MSGRSRPRLLADRFVEWFRGAVEARLPWYDVEAERARNARTEAIRQRSIAERIRVERSGILDDYQRGDQAMRRDRR